VAPEQAERTLQEVMDNQLKTVGAIAENYGFTLQVFSLFCFVFFLL
jgi:hypothetical protein